MSRDLSLVYDLHRCLFSYLPASCLQIDFRGFFICKLRPLNADENALHDFSCEMQLIVIVENAADFFENLCKMQMRKLRVKK